MGDEDDTYNSQFTYAIIILAVILHICIMLIVIYYVCRNNRCQCCVIHRHDNNIRTVVVAQRNPPAAERSVTESQTNLIASSNVITRASGLTRQTSLRISIRTRNSDDSQSEPPPYEETGEGQGEINEGFLTVDLPTYEEYARNFPPVYDEGSPPKYDEVCRPSED